MNLDQTIEALGAIRAKHGGHVDVVDAEIIPVSPALQSVEFEEGVVQLWFQPDLSAETES